jgi:hypothetical protein
VARLDKLVADLTECGEMPFHLPPRFVHDVVTAGRLEKAWRARYRFDYFMIDEIRTGHLAARWRLREQLGAHKHTALPGPLALSKPGPTPETRPEAVRFKPGGCVALNIITTLPTEDNNNRWWPNITCARLDGIVGTERETTSRGDDHTPTLPLLTGREMNIGHSRVRYFREGTLANMHPLLMSQTDKHIRVLRGHQLRSHFAPVVGIRNDGLWVYFGDILLFLSQLTGCWLQMEGPQVRRETS